MIELTGDYTDAKIFLSREDIEENTIEQTQEAVDSEGITNQVRVMPDCHVGAGCVIGFTMPFSEKVIPNIVGVDVGCGVLAVRLGDLQSDSTIDFDTIDTEIRQNIPLGKSVYKTDGYHLVNIFPWEKATERLIQFSENNSVDLRTYDDFDGYGEQYFKDLCERVEYDINRAINSLGTLGGGNHFIEISESQNTGDHWCVIHSGSRGIGNEMASYWQEQANIKHDDRSDRIRSQLQEYPEEYYRFNLESISDKDLLEYCQGGKGEDWKNMEVIRNEYLQDNPQKIEIIKKELTEIGKIAHEDQTKTDLAYLEGEQAKGYLIDMIFAQMYASLSRRKMAERIATIVGSEIQEEIESVHNFIDFRDGIIRKGATRSYKNEKSVIPFNMKDGTIIVEGKSNPDWNYSVCHGAGRVMSRVKARETLDMETFVTEMDSIYTTSLSEDTIEEDPRAYKNIELIKNAIKPTATILDTLKPVYNIKAED